MMPVFLAIFGTLFLVGAFQIVASMPAVVGYKAGLGTSIRHDLPPDSIDPSWIISGTPTFKTAVFERSPFWGTSSGIWEAAGPASFVWHYSVDEVIYILEGKADIEYEGRKFTLQPGESTRFVAGTSAKWVVDDRVKKTFRIQQTGRLVRWMRTIFG